MKEKIYFSKSGNCIEADVTIVNDEFNPMVVFTLDKNLRHPMLALYKLVERYHAMLENHEATGRCFITNGRFCSFHPFKKFAYWSFKDITFSNCDFEDFRIDPTVEFSTFISCSFKKGEFFCCQTIRECVFKSCSFNNVKFDMNIEDGTVFDNCEITSCDFNSDIEKNLFNECNISSVKFWDNKLKDVDFENCIISDIEFIKSFLDCVDFSAKCKNLNLSGCDSIRGTTLNGNDVIFVSFGKTFGAINLLLIGDKVQHNISSNNGHELNLSDFKSFISSVEKHNNQMFWDENHYKFLYKTEKFFKEMAE